MLMQSFFTKNFEMFSKSCIFFFFFLIYLLLLNFKLQGTCAQRAGLLHMYTCAMLVCCTHQLVIYIRYNSQCNPSPLPPPRDRPRCVMFPFPSPSDLIVQFPPTSENMRCLVFCSCDSLLRMMVSSCIHGNLLSINKLLHFPILTAPGNDQCAFYLCGFTYCGYFI